MAKKNVPLVGESWATSATHTKGFDQFGSVTFHLGAEPLVTALEGRVWPRGSREARGRGTSGGGVPGGSVSTQASNPGRLDS
jgi:putative glutamine amidotransferase